MSDEHRGEILLGATRLDARPRARARADLPRRLWRRRGVCAALAATARRSLGSSAIAELDAAAACAPEKLASGHFGEFGADFRAQCLGMFRQSGELAVGRILFEEYHPFGTTSYHAWDSSAEVSAKRYRYTGKERDEETGLSYHGARYLATWLGRWTSADPAGLVDGPNLYGYCRGDPVGGSDPSGLDGPVSSPATPWAQLWSDLDKTYGDAPPDIDTGKSRPAPGQHEPDRTVVARQRRWQALLDDHAARGVPCAPSHHGDFLQGNRGDVPAGDPSITVLAYGVAAKTAVELMGGEDTANAPRTDAEARNAPKSRSELEKIATTAINVLAGKLVAKAFGLLGRAAKEATLPDAAFDPAPVPPRSPFPPTAAKPERPLLEGGPSREPAPAATTAPPAGAAGERASLPTFLNRGDPAPGQVLGTLDGNAGQYTVGGVTRQGTFDFVVQDGVTRIGHGHWALAAGGKPVSYAGTITFSETGAILEWTNASGHYRPSALFAGNAGLPLQLFRPVEFPAMVGNPEVPMYRDP